MENHGSPGSYNYINNRGREVYDFEKYSVYEILALEQLFKNCENVPTESQTLAMISAHRFLSNLGSHQIQVWFHNRRHLKEQNQEGVMLVAVLKKLSQVLNLENEYLHSVVQHMETEKVYMENLKQYISSVHYLVAADLPRHVFRNAKMNALTRLLMLENDFIRSELEQLWKENEYMVKTKTPSSMLMREGRLDELMEIMTSLSG